MKIEGMDIMANESPYRWADVQRHFPREEVARLRKTLMEERALCKFTDRELIEKYRMTKRTFYKTVKRYRNAKEEKDFMDKSKAPYHPARKVGEREIEIIREIVQTDRETLEK